MGCKCKKRKKTVIEDILTSDYTTREERNRRLAICRSCSYYNALLVQCKHCKCLLKLKVKFKNQSCGLPQAKW